MKNKRGQVISYYLDNLHLEDGGQRLSVELHSNLGDIDGELKCRLSCTYSCHPGGYPSYGGNGLAGVDLLPAPVIRPEANNVQKAKLVLFDSAIGLKTKVPHQWSKDIEECVYAQDYFALGPGWVSLDIRLHVAELTVPGPFAGGRFSIGSNQQGWPEIWGQGEGKPAKQS